MHCSMWSTQGQYRAAGQGVLVTSTDQQLIKISEAYTALQVARTLPEVKQIRDIAAALQRYAQQQHYTFEIQQDAAELKLRAERKAGQLLAQADIHGGDRKSSSRQENLKLIDLGITHNQSHRWQQIAGLPDENFE